MGERRRGEKMDKVLTEPITDFVKYITTQRVSIILLCAMSLIIWSYIVSINLLNEVIRLPILVSFFLLSFALPKCLDILVENKIDKPEQDTFEVLEYAKRHSPCSKKHTKHNVLWLEIWYIESGSVRPKWEQISGPFCPTCEQPLYLVRKSLLCSNKWKCYRCKKFYGRPDTRSDEELRQELCK